MLRDELLRTKNDEIARCLSSRKRKLSELYFATVGVAGATDGAPTDARYRQKEQAFLDANDLSRGRYFNESTLPPLPNYATISSQPETKEPAPPIAEQRAKPDSHFVATETPDESRRDAAISPPTSITTAHQRPVKERQPIVVPAQQDAMSRVQPPAPGTVSESQQARDEPTPATSHRMRSPGAEEDVKLSPSKAPPSDHEHDFAGVRVPHGRPAPTHPTGASLESAEISPARKKEDKRPSPTLRPPHPTEQPLSPGSSVDPHSNNTPVPAAISPDTSPAEEVADSRAKIDQKPTEDKLQGHPSVVPSTPDEQLRLEEAQSLQHGTLEAGKSVDDKAGGGPSVVNEVIQKEVGPPPTADKGQATLVQEAPSVPESQEFQQPDGVVDVPQLGPARHPDEAEVKEAPTPTTLKKAPSTPSAQPGPSQPERMTTRVSSGAIRHKSVSEILGETPKLAAASHTDRSTELMDSDKATPESPARMRLKDRKERERERSRLSTVVFPKQQQLLQQGRNGSMDLARQGTDELHKVNEEQDYLFTLFQKQAYSQPRGQSLSSLLASAHKTLSTANHLVDYSEQMDCRTLHRIYSLQHANRWPLRQLKRSIEPPRQGTHWDILLDHMQWMRTDFREERKWKIAAAKCCAEWCAEYVNSDPEHQALLRVPVKIPPKPEETEGPKAASPETGDELHDAPHPVSHPTPDLVPSAEDESVSDSVNDEPHHDIRDTIAPAAIFSLGSDEFTFSLDMTPTAEKLLGELPIYAPAKISPDTNTPTFNTPPDSIWKTEILPVSKYATGKITFDREEPPRKRSRYDYSQYKDDPENQIVELPPEQTNVALFRPESRHIRDRIHPGHSFRPPTEHPMPSVGFFESRQSSQWTYAEDDELRQLVREYSYNWSLISSCLSPPSLFSSGAERRTPWECFERWISLEGLPADMSKTQYFRAYHQRLETAQRTVLAQQQAAQQQQQQSNGQQPQLPIRRRTIQPLRVDRRRSSKHFALLDAMRKLAKKRETMLQKQQQAAHLASLRKANETTHPKPIISSPAEFSRLKYDREMKLQERQEQYRQQMIAQQRANMAAQRGGQVPNQQSMVNAPGRNPNGMPQNSANPGMAGGTPNGMPNGMPSGVGVNQGRPPAMQGMPGGPSVNGPMPSNGMAMKMMPQSGMQQAPGARPGMAMQGSPDGNTRVIREANRLQEQQRILQTRQQQQQQQQGQPQQQFPNQQQFGPQGSHSPNLNMANVNGGPNNPGMVAALQAGGGMQSPSFHNTPQGVSTPSPRMGQPNPLSSGVVPTISSIQSQIQRNNPNMTPEQVSKLATDRLHQYQQQRMSQVAMNAAAGNIGAAQPNYQGPPDGNFQQQSQHGMNGGGMQVHQAQGYSPMMRVPQNAQQSRAGVNSPAMNGAMSQQSRSSTPQTQRGGNGQGGSKPGSSNSPHPQQAQIASG